MKINREKRRDSGVPFSTMADIAFLLLIFFMLSAIVDTEKEIPLQLPESGIMESQTGGFLSIWVTEQGEIYFDNKSDTLENLPGFAEYSLAMNPEIKALIIADKKVHFSRVNSVMEALRSAELYNITLVRRKKEGG